MNQWSHEQFSKVQMAGFDTIVGLTNKALEGFERLLELNLQTMKTTLVDTRHGVEKAMAAKNSQEFADLQIELFQPSAAKVLAYRRDLYDILAATQAEFDKVFEVQYAESKCGLETFLESMVNSAPGAPGGLAAPLTAWGEGVKATTTLYESMQSTAKQAVHVAESSFNTAAEAASKGVRQGAAQPSWAAAK